MESPIASACGAGDYAAVQVRSESVCWREYREHVLDYAALDLDRRRQIVFRGQGSRLWPLETSLDRWQRFDGDAARKDAIDSLIDGFRSEVILADLQADVSDLRLLELLARHHGLPSPLLDWSSSPYVAAFFAFEAMCQDDGAVSVWSLDRGGVPASATGFEFVDEPEMLRFNPRALRQHGVFVRVNSIAHPLEELLGSALMRFDIDVADARLALADLDAMRINAANLYGDLDGVSRTVVARYGATHPRRP